MSTVWSSSKRTIVTSILIVAAVAAGLLVGAMTRPSTKAAEAPTPNVCADTSAGKGGSAGTNETGVTENTTSVTTTETPASTSTTTNNTTTTTKEVHHNHNLVNVDNVLNDVEVLNDNSILNENTVKVLNDVLSVGDVTATVTDNLNGTVKTVVEVL